MENMSSTQPKFRVAASHVIVLAAVLQLVVNYCLDKVIDPWLVAVVALLSAAVFTGGIRDAVARRR